MAGSSTTEAGRPGTGARPAFGPPFFDPARRTEWDLGDTVLDLSRPRIMGILNLTPDSFSDGGELARLDDALERAEKMIEAGADILDVGGESTRPGAEEVPAAEELRRILPFLREAAGRLPVPISVDTRKVEVARAAVEEGAAIVNDVSGLRHDPEMPGFVAEAGVGVVLMHMRGTPANMRSLTEYEDVVADVRDELADRVKTARAAGVRDDRIVVDPGLGFAKDSGQTLRLVRDVHRLLDLGFPVLVGPSRKSFIGAVLGTPPGQRVEGTLAACTVAYLGGARIFRVHDVEPAARALEVARAVVRGAETGDGGPGESEGADETTETEP